MLNICRASFEAKLMVGLQSDFSLLVASIDAFVFGDKEAKKKQ